MYKTTLKKRLRQKEYYRNNRLKQIEWQKEYRLNNVELLREKDKIRNLKRRDKIFNKNKNKKCICGKTIWRTSEYCRSCATIYQNKKNGNNQKGKTRELSANWRGGRTVKNGYIYVYIKNHPYCGRDGYVSEHRLVMEKHLGRYLTKEEVVHHIDKNKHNNSINNLMLFPSTSAHIKFHRLKKNGN